MAGFQTRLLRILRSPQFFAAILLLFFLESVWIALSAAYPMVFDENIHFTLIQAYAHQWSPLWPAHSTATDAAGAVVRDPSYLYHYLMSFPYRLISAVTGDQMVQVIDLRFINILLFGGSLVLFRRLLFKTKISPAIIHTTLLFFVLTPVVPLLAGQINYDNLVMLVTAASLLLTISISQVLHSEHRLPVTKMLALLTVGLLGSLVQFEYLPLLTAIIGWLAWQIWREAHSGRLALRPALRRSWSAASWHRKLAVGLPLLVATGLFLQMYGINLVRYHNITPICSQVLTEQQCAGSGAWVRAQQALAHKGPVNTNPIVFVAAWLYRMLVAMFNTSSGGASPQANFLSVNPLPVIFAGALVVVVIGIALVVKYRWRVFHGYEYLGFLLFTALLYGGSLLAHNYLDFVHLGQKYAIQGRYLFPIALPCMVIIALAFRQLLGSRARLKVGLVVALFVLFLQGGGALTYVIDSDQNWYWQNHAVQRLNKVAQQVVKPLIIVKTPLRSFGHF